MIFQHQECRCAGPGSLQTSVTVNCLQQPHSLPHLHPQIQPDESWAADCTCPVKFPENLHLGVCRIVGLPGVMVRARQGTSQSRCCSPRGILTPDATCSFSIGEAAGLVESQTWVQILAQPLTSVASDKLSLSFLTSKSPYKIEMILTNLKHY